MYATQVDRKQIEDVNEVYCRTFLQWTIPIKFVVSYCSALIDCLVQPLQEKMEDWRRTSIQMDKDHAKGEKRRGHVDKFA